MPEADHPSEESVPEGAGTAIAAERRRGRGAGTNASGRYERESRSSFDDGWDIEDELPPLRTEVATDRSRTIIARNTSPDVPFDRSINPYRGCEHGCIYCFARPTHAYLGLSPGLDFETKLTVKPDAARLLEVSLRRPGYRVAPIAIGTNTDPYQPIEREHRIMRQVLEVLRAYRHPVTIVTKGAIISRDVDILGDMAADGLARVAISLTSLDHRLSRIMEPRAASPQRRLDAIRRLSEAGIQTGVMTAPLIPAINDSEIEALLGAAKDAGAVWADYVALRMPLEIKDLFREWLDEHFPDRAGRVIALIREMHGGKDYDPQWGRRMRGEGVYAKLIAQRFTLAQRRFGLDGERHKLRTDLFQPPPSPLQEKTGDQLGLPL
ncbi:MAG: PA0069 family radical SAM protein [Pseudomonadota bacterium]